MSDACDARDTTPASTRRPSGRRPRSPPRSARRRRRPLRRCSRSATCGRGSTPGPARSTPSTASTSRCASGEVLGLVGESGSGKSVTMLSVMRLVDQPGRIVSGAVTFDGIDVLALPRNAMRSLRGDRISMIFQQPNASLHPCFTAGVQISEVYEIHRNSRRAAGLDKAVEMLRTVGIPDAEAAGQVVPAPALGRPGPAGDDRHGARRRARAAHRRRADDGARRHDPGADPRPDAGAASRAGHEHGADHPRSRRRRRDGPPRRRDVRRPDRRGGAGRGAVRRPQASRTPAACSARSRSSACATTS